LAPRPERDGSRDQRDLSMSLVMSDCRQHPDRPALGTCVTCGSFMCAECRVPSGQHALLLACSERCRWFADGQLELAMKTAAVNRTNAQYLVVSGTVFSLIGLVIFADTVRYGFSSILILPGFLLTLGLLFIFFGRKTSKHFSSREARPPQQEDGDGG
jgi:hypothetical protein